MQKKIIAFLILFSAYTSVRADAPLPSPEVEKFWSQGREYYVISTPGENPTTAGYSSGDKEEKWNINQWFRVGFLAHDGKSFVGMYNGVNLIPIDCSDDTVLLSFWNKGKLQKEYTLKELKVLGLELERTTSHFYWAVEFDLMGMGFRLVDGKGNEFIFMPESGKLIYKGKLKPVYE